MVIARAYAVISEHSVSFPLGVCRCNVCCSEEHERLLSTTPLRQISSALLSEHTNSAHGYDESSDGHVLRYLLPRYFELIALNDPPHYGDLAHCLVRLGAADYRRNWTPEETTVIDQFFDALLRDKLNDLSLTLWPVGYSLTYPIDELLAMALLAGGHIDRLLACWDHAAEPGASAHIAAVAMELTSIGGEMALHSYFLKEHAIACLAVGRFVCRRAHIVRLERAFYDLEGQPDLQGIWERTCHRTRMGLRHDERSICQRLPDCRSDTRMNVTGVTG